MAFQNSLGFMMGQGITNRILFPMGKMAVGGLFGAAKTMGRGGLNVARRTDWRGMGRSIGAGGEYVWTNRREIARRVGRGSKAAYGATLGRDVRFYRGIGGKVARRAFQPALSAAFVGYEVSQGRNAAEGVLKGGVEIGALAAGTAGASIGAGMLSFIPGVGTLIGGIIGFGVGYSGVHKLLDPGFTTRQAPQFENVYMNRRALTMRQASMMQLAKSSRAAFGNEAQSMHLR